MLVLFLKALQPGERWITVRAPGHDKGQPILIKQQPDGSAKVIGGAGGSLNHLRLTGVKDKGSYKDAIRDRAKVRKEERAKRKQLDRVMGLKESKDAAHQRVSAQKRVVDRDFVHGVADAMGWDKSALTFDRTAHADKAPEVVERLEAAHLNDLVKRAREAVDVNRVRLLHDADARAEADLGQVPLSAPEDATISVADLDNTKLPSAGLGFSTDYKGRAEAAGLTGDDLKEEAAAAKKNLSEGQRKAGDTARGTAAAVREQLELLRETEPDKDLAPKLLDAKKAMDVIRLDKKRRLAEKQARAAHKKIAESTVEPKAFVIDIDEARVEDAAKAEVDQDLRTIATRSFLSEVAKTADDPGKALVRHVGVGAYNSINALALAAGGAALVDRSVVDVLGIAGAAEVLSRRLHADLKPAEMEHVTEGMQEFHLKHYMETSESAMAEARELHDRAKEIELGRPEAGDDLPALQEINRRKGEAIGEAHRILGEALGEMEANAALVYSLKRGPADKPFEVSLGSVSVESAIQQARAIGLQRGDYAVETVAGNRVLSVLPEGMDRLAKPVNRADIEQVRRNLDIIGGKYDEDGWLPLGVSDRPDLDLHLEPGVAPSLAAPFSPSGPLEGAVKDYIGGRAADGDLPADIVADLQSAEFFQKVGAGRAEEYRDVLDRLAPLKTEDGKMQSAEALRPAFEAMADEYVGRQYGADRTPLHRQSFPVDDVAVDALHRALAAEPSGAAAYKAIGDMTPQDQGALRDWFGKNIAKESPEAEASRRDLDKLDQAEPERETQDMFGDKSTNPEWTDWKGGRDALAAKVNAASLTWPKYVEAMHGPERAYSAMQDLVRSTVTRGFADSYNKLRPDAPLKIGRGAIRNSLDHEDAVDPSARAARAEKEHALVDTLRERSQGRYASGSVRDKLDSARDQQAGFEAAQMGFFASDGDLAGSAEKAPEKPLETGERYSIGHEAERQISKIMPQVGANFRAGQPTKLFRPSMSGAKNAPRQRAIKYIEANKRAALSFGVGSGKTLIGLGGYTHLQQQGKAKRGLFLVPSIVQGQFGGEALRFLKPGTFNWHAKPGASRDERIAAYKNPEHNFCVMTHQSYRDDMLHLGAQHAGVSPEEMTARVDGMPRAERAAWLKGVAEKEGINFDYVNVDEGHNTLNREGKENSALANVVDAAGDNAEYYVNASGDPVKNDVSEAFSLLQKMDPARYTDQAAFLRKYGVDTIASQGELRREMARFQYPHKIDPDVVAHKIERQVPISEGQSKALAEVDKAAAAVRLARMKKEVDVEAVKKLSPSSFEGVPEDQHHQLASDLQRDMGILKNTAVRRIIDTHADSPKVDDVVRVAKERNGKPGVIFAHSLAAVEQMRDRLQKEGFRVVTITGKDSAKEKEAKRQKFHPDAGEPEADILLASDAGATGMNVQRGQWCVQYDTPMTAMTHAQRQGRIHRIGQTNDVELIDLIADHPEERRARARLKLKYALRDAMTSPMESLDDTGLAWFLRQRDLAAGAGARDDTRQAA